MKSLFQTNSQRSEAPRQDKRLSLSFSRNNLFGNRVSDEWRQQIDFTAGIHHPSSSQFPWALVRKHTEAYIKKKGKLSQTEINIRLGVLISTHDAKDIAIAACAHAMTPASLRAILNVQLNVAPATFSGLEMYLQSLIAANHCNPISVSNIEALWARIILPYAREGTVAAGRFLEGVRWALCQTDTPNMNAVPDFSILISRALDTFASQLDGFRLKCQWKSAYFAVAWMFTITKSSPAITPPGKILPEHLFDTQFPVWRIWSAWQPDQERISMLEGQESAKTSVLTDLLALEGPDFATGQRPTLREGLIAQYGAQRPLMQFRSLLVEVNSCSREELKGMLNKTAALMQIALEEKGSSYELFVQLTIGRPITQENLQIMEGLFNFPATLGVDLGNAVLQILLAQHDIGGRHLIDLSYIILALDHPQGARIRDVLLCPWLVQGIEKCLSDCQVVVRTRIEKELEWTHLLRELHSFCQMLQGSEYVLPLLSDGTRQQMDATSTTHSLETLLEIYENDRTEAAQASIYGTSALKNKIETFFIDRFMEKGTVPTRIASCSLLEAVLKVWNQTNAISRRRLAIIVARLPEWDYRLQAKRISQIVELPDEFVKTTVSIFTSPDAKGPAGCVEMTDLLFKTERTNSIVSWKGLLYHMLKNESDKLIDYTLDQFELIEWVAFMMKLNSLFKYIINDEKANPPYVLQLKFHSRIQRLFGSPVITALEATHGERAKSALKCIFKNESEAITLIIKSLTKAQNQPVEKTMQEIVCHLSADGQNASAVSNCAKALLATSPTGYSTFQDVLKIFKRDDIPTEVHQVQLASWLEDQDDFEFFGWDKFAIKALAGIFNVQTYEAGVPAAVLMKAMEYYEDEEAKILAEADRLDVIKNSLKAHDSQGTATLLRDIGYPDLSQLEEELLHLPPGIVDFVEKHSPNEIEISFPLDAFTDLQRAATGVGQAKSLLVRMFIDYDGDAPNGFCMHLDEEELGGWHLSPVQPARPMQHTPWVHLIGSVEPDGAFCHGRQTILTFQLCRVLHRHMRLIRELGVTGIHTLMKRWLDDYAQFCLVCGVPHRSISGTKATLRKPLPCIVPSCTKLWNSLPISVRIPELRTDPFVVDLLLTAAYVAASSGRMELLPGCPFPNYTNVKTILNTIPALSSWKCQLGETNPECFGKEAEKLLIWACTHFRGFISSASGICRIANLPTGTHQFVLANAKPELERAFNDKLPRNNPQTRVLFHGTSLDRLPCILSEGLKIQSGTSMQRTGAAHGKGIYLAEDPATSFSYAPSAVSWANSGLNNMRLLLGCEVIGNGNRVNNTGVHVIKDESTVMIRYVFLMTNSAYAPNANHITTPMLSAMCAMRSGAV